MVDGRPVSRGQPAPPAPWPCGWTASRARCGPSEVGSPFAFGHRPYFSDEGHQGHVHIGYGQLSG